MTKEEFYIDKLTVFEVVVKDANATDLERSCDELRKNSARTFMNNILKPAIAMKLVEPLYPDSPHHPKQKYRLTDIGKAMMSVWNKEEKSCN